VGARWVPTRTRLCEYYLRSGVDCVGSCVL